MNALLPISILIPALWTAADADYAREVKPILAARCTSCHGAIRQKGGLRLDTAALAKRGGDSGPAIEPGKPEESAILERVAAREPELRMPPPSEGTPLSESEIATLRRWIESGATAPEEPIPPDPREHWAYRPPVRPPVPDLGPDWAGNPIDAFLEAGRRRKGLKPAPPASREQWLRRVTLDLIGLPPTPEERRAFLADDSPDAPARAVDRLLASPAHAERWARHWMDIWRYSDWYGLGQELRFSHYHIWRWRDWIVESLASDKGYDRMVVEMLAGDEVAPDDPAVLRATGYLARNWDIFNRNAWLDSTVQHTARAFLGVTIQCARCHDHKFDPISQQDYYRFRAFFEPYHIRIDRVPGQPDRAKDGLTRAFDDFLDTPTYLFRRGDEAAPDKSRPLTPSTPAVLGGAVRIESVALPLAAHTPDAREFVIREAREVAAKAVAESDAVAAKALASIAQTERELSASEAEAQAAVEALHSAPTPETRKPLVATLAKAEARRAKAKLAAEAAPKAVRLAELDRDRARARQEALDAVLRVEELERSGAKGSASETWAKAATAASDAQRRQSLAEATRDQFAATLAVDRALTLLEGRTTEPGTKDPAATQAEEKAAGDLAEARAALVVAEDRLAKVRVDTKAPPTTAYTPRPLEFPRAKTTYRDTPSNAPYPKVSTGRRLALARWITDGKNPLTARVAVNQIWARHFGEPLVPSVFDFGLRAPQPEHLALLDWLAVEFVESGWSMKRLHRLIVTSKAYAMQSSPLGPDDPNAAIDPDNRSLWRMNVRRMEAEVIRDSLLAMSGTLDPTRGGPDLPAESADEGRRRSLYYRYARGDRSRFLAMFDAPNVEECYRRSETIVPQQALALTNGKLPLARAAEIASALTKSLGDPADDAAFVSGAFERVLGRLPSDAERAECVASLAGLGGDGPPSREKDRAALIHVLINHNDFVSIR